MAKAKAAEASKVAPIPLPEGKELFVLFDKTDDQPIGIFSSREKLEKADEMFPGTTWEAVYVLDAGIAAIDAGKELWQVTYHEDGRVTAEDTPAYQWAPNKGSARIWQLAHGKELVVCVWALDKEDARRAAETIKRDFVRRGEWGLFKP